MVKAFKQGGGQSQSFKNLRLPPFMEPKGGSRICFSPSLAKSPFNAHPCTPGCGTTPPATLPTCGPSMSSFCVCVWLLVSDLFGLCCWKQAAKAAVEAPRALASQLEASLASVSALTLELQKERSMLSRATSIGASSAHHDVRAELTQQLQAGKYEEAFGTVLGMQVGLFDWQFSAS